MGVPNKREIEKFAKVVSQKLHNLNFDLKREIVLSTVEKVVGTQEKLQVYGYIPINHVKFKTIGRYSQNTTQHLIPFSFIIKLPRPQNLFGNT